MKAIGEVVEAVVDKDVKHTDRGAAFSDEGVAVCRTTRLLQVQSVLVRQTVHPKGDPQGAKDAEQKRCQHRAMSYTTLHATFYRFFVCKYTHFHRMLNLTQPPRPGVHIVEFFSTSDRGEKFDG